MMSAHSTSSRQIGRLIAKPLARHIGDKHGAGAIRRIVKLLAAVVVTEMLGVFRAQECALMMIEPPGQARIGRVLEIDDRVDVAIEQAVLKKLRRFVSQAGEFEIGVRARICPR